MDDGDVKGWSHEPLDSPILSKLPNLPVLASDPGGSREWDPDYPGNASLASSVPCILLGWELWRKCLDGGWGCQRSGAQLWSPWTPQFTPPASAGG